MVTYKVEVVADSSGKFCGNGLVFDAIDKAVEYAKDLYSRWTLVEKWRVVEVETGNVVREQ